MGKIEEKFDPETAATPLPYRGEKYELLAYEGRTA
jgi:hypothetical protein